MSDRIVNTIAEALAEADDIIYGLLTPDETEHYLKGARAVLAALRANNIEPIQLPAHLGINGEDNRVWSRDPYVEQQFNGDVIISDRVGVPAGELRSLAAALLAAAAAAEEGK